MFLIAGQSGDVGKAVVAAAGLEGALTASTIVVWDGSRGLIRSDAILAIACQCSAGRGEWSRGARVVPRAWRDASTQFVATRRARVDAEEPACGVPPADLVAAWRARLATASDVPELDATRT